MRQIPFLYLSMSSTFVSGFAISLLYPYTKFEGTTVVKVVKFGIISGLIILPFIALELPGRFSIPSWEKWIFFHSVLGIFHC